MASRDSSHKVPLNVQIDMAIIRNRGMKKLNLTSRENDIHTFSLVDGYSIHKAFCGVAQF